MRKPTLALMRRWEELAHIMLGGNHRWLEELNQDKVLYYRWLLYASFYCQPKVAVELGVAKGRASAHIAAGASMTIGIDRAPDRPELEQNIELIHQHGLGYTFLEMDSTSKEAVDAVAQICGPNQIELLFIDSLHLYTQAITEYRSYRHLLADPCLIVMDDILDPPNQVGHAFAEIPGEKLEMNQLHIALRGSVGFGAIIHKGG